MEPVLWIYTVGLIHSMIFISDAKTINRIMVPHRVPVGYLLTNIPVLEYPAVLDSDDKDALSLFEYQVNGALVTQQDLADYSGKHFTLVVKNGLSERVLNSIHISISESNDLVFHESSYIGTIRENQKQGTEVQVVGQLSILDVTDASYSLLTNTNIFKIESTKYGSTTVNKILTLQPLNYEEKTKYKLSVQAETKDETAVTTVEVYVIDENDNVPKFVKDVVRVVIEPNQSWNKVVTLRAVDADSNDEITYSLDDSSIFVIDPESGDVYSEGDYVYPGSYSLNVFATDAAAHVSDPLPLYIEVQSDALKYRPESHVHHLSKRSTTTIYKTHDIVENSTSTDSLFSVASVQFRPPGSTEKYSLLSSSVDDIFEQPDFNGRVYLKYGKRLDYEKVEHREILLTFSRTDTESPEDTTVVEVTLRVKDKNDEKPIFKNEPVPFLAAVSTNPANGENVYTLFADDPDTNSDIEYHLESGGEGKFRIITETDPDTADKVGKIVTTVSGPGQFINGVTYTLVVSAQDLAAGNSPPQKSNFALVKVLVGLRPPQLFNNPFMARVYENSGTGHKIMGADDGILVIRAKCFQDVAKNKVTFDLTELSGRISGLFSISNKGTVETLQNLDYEKPPNQYILNVTATEVESGLASSAQLIIDVLDVNDNSPKFQLSTYTFVLSEDTQINGPAIALQVTATDRDSGLNGQLEYTVSDDHFSIQTRVINNKYIGEIKLAKALDYDFLPDHQYRFNVTATDKGEPRRSGLATVIVYVTNVNDEAPVFGTGSDHLYASINEEQTVGSVVTIVQATDPDGDNIKYYFTPRSIESNPFKIDPDSGLITLMMSLPESVPYYTLNITAYDDGSCCASNGELSSNTYIIVEVKDTNNNQPQFPDCFYKPSIEENAPIGTFVVQVQAVDDDRGANGNISYSIVTSPRQFPQFEVDPFSGRVVTAVRFDREAQGDRGIPVTVKAADQGKPQSLDSHCTFWVQVTDANDNRPVFDSPSYSTSISESSAVIGRRVFAVRATDKDKGKNADIVYSLTENPGGFFTVEKDTGIIFMAKALHGTDNVVLKVKAEDRGDIPMHSFSSVTISITDRTNNPPTWDANNYEREYEVKETEGIGHVIARMRAASNTPAPFDGLSFALIDSGENTVQQLGPFRIYQDGNEVKLILKAGLDYNIQNRYELRLRVTNQGQTPLSAEIRPVIVVKDMNNEPPQFEGLDPTLSNSYRGSVPENEGAGQTVLRIKAVDPDHDEPNNLVSYSLMSDRNDAYMNFDIDSKTGEIRTMATFDREKQSVYYIKVMATDGTISDAPGHFPENTPNSATAQVQVIIADKNDNPPYFTQELWEISVPEQRADTSGRILTVTAKDKDEADQLVYTITEGNVGNVFGIKQKTGDIYVAKTLDYETPPTTYTLKVMVQDGRFENFTTVKIDVTDVNDNAPEFERQVYQITNIMEEVVPPYPDGQFLVQVSASDKDISRRNNFKYYISGDGTNLNDPTFTIEANTGQIFLRKALDRDLPTGREVYQFNVIVEDEPDTGNPLYGYAYVKVMPRDINDNAPMFKEEDLQGSVPEHSKKGQSVMTVVATDMDAGENGTVFYEIDRFGGQPARPNGDKLFTINRETGLIQTRISNSLDREKTAQYFVPVVAKDMGSEQRSATATVTISISDINDQVPKFVKKIYRVSMSENQIGGAVVTVSATDNDIDENARLTYTLKESDRSFFSIDTIPPNAGVLTVFNPIDYEKTKFFNLTVYVQDSNPKHKDVAYIEVTVEDYNDNAPEFYPKVVTIPKKENIPEGTSLWNCTASDNDDGINAQFEYSIDRRTDEGRRFTVDAKCNVKIRRGLDGETLDREALAGLPKEQYEVHILAIDKGYPPKTGTATMRIPVEDVNDNAPDFVLPHPPVVMEDEPPNQLVVTFSATDRDTPQYGPPFHFALPPCEQNPTCRNGVQDFIMTFNPFGDDNRGTGTVISNATFDRFRQKFYYLPVIMTDMRGKNSAQSMSAVRQLKIEIGDINNNPHGEGHKDIFVYKYDFKGIAEEYAIGSVYAEDRDDWDVVDKHFYFTGPGVMEKYFRVDFNTGEIFMNKDTPQGVHDFTANVWDFRVFTDINATSTVRVVVEEITDDAIFSSGSLRFTGMTAEEFIRVPGPNQKSPYEKFRDLIATKLNVPLNNVALFSVMNGKDNAYTDIRFSAHGSPWYQASKLDSIVATSKQEFQQEVGIEITMIKIDMCLRELCEAGGCANILKVGDQPNYVNANGTSFIGIATSVTAECQCKAKNFTLPSDCVPGYCYNGGQCVKDEWGDVRCLCNAKYDGPRCQMTRHSFNEGYALFAPFEQCEHSTTSIEILSESDSGLIFYNGPVEELGRDDPTDFIALSLIEGYPMLQLDHGTGRVTLTLDGRDGKGDRFLQKLNDGRWHHIDIIRKGKTVTMVVDRCEMTDVDSAADSQVDRRPCEVSARTPGENFYLNVNTPLQLGGRYATPTKPGGVPGERFKGCVRNLIHNGELYDLSTGKHSPGENHDEGCRKENQICGAQVPGASSHCGPNGVCEVTDAINLQFKCVCKPGYRPTAAQGQDCKKATTVRDLQESSFMSWSLKPEFFNAALHPRTTDVQLRFRTRDLDGILLHLPSNSEEFITLELQHGHLTVLYYLGGSGGESSLTLAKAPASNGQWHTVFLKRIGSWFQLKMDGGEGRYYNESWGPASSHQLISIKMYQITAGAHVAYNNRNPIENGQDLNRTCIEDIRLNSKWFPMMNSENDLSEAATLDYEQNVENDCTRDDCKNVICPSGSPYSMICYPLWGIHDCRCPPGTYASGVDCRPINYCEQDKPCFVGSECRNERFPQNFTCVCPAGWTGRLCNILSASVPAQAGLTTGFIVIIIICIFVVLIVALFVFLIVRYKKKTDPEKYILDVDPEDDIRENVINYNEEGAGEEDQDMFDISRLRKPDDSDGIKRLYEPKYGKRAPGERPDVGSFIDQRLNDADGDPHAPPHDSVREFVYEGGGSDTGSLSSLQTNSSNEEQDYDYLTDWGPKFARLANMYGWEEDE